MGREYELELPEWAWNPRMRSKVRGWIAFNYSSDYEGKRALISWAEGMRERGYDVYVSEYEVNIVRETIKMRNRLIFMGFL